MSFKGNAVEIAGNASNVKGGFSLRYNPLKDIGFSWTIDDKDGFEEYNHGPYKIERMLLNDTSWEGMFNLYFGY
jgi:hypothetical protein